MANRKELFDKFEGEVKAASTAAGRRPRKQKSIYGDQLLCLCVLLGMSVWISGFRALVIGAVSVLVCILSDMLFCRMTRKTYNPKDLSTIYTGLCLALMMPSSVNYAIVIGGALLALSVKHIFGGKDNYIFNPTCVAVAFLIICYPEQMLLYPEAAAKPAIFGDVGVNLVPGVENYLLKLGTAPAVNIQNILLGSYAGPMGTTHILIIVVCAVCLLCRRSVSAFVTLFSLGSYCALTALFPVFSNIGDTLLMELCGGYLLFGAVFLASDPQTLPKTADGRIAYGILIGIVGCLFRHFGKVEGSFIFVLLIANAFSLNMDTAIAAVAKAVRTAIAYLRGNMGRYERLRKETEDGGAPRLSDTMEIIVPPTNYHMPPIDNKVTKINRKKTNFITRYARKMRLKRRKEELIRQKQQSAQAEYLNNIRKMEKHSHESVQKPEGQKTNVLHRMNIPKKRSEQKTNKSGK